MVKNFSLVAVATLAVGCGSPLFKKNKGSSENTPSDTRAEILEFSTSAPNLTKNGPPQQIALAWKTKSATLCSISSANEEKFELTDLVTGTLNVEVTDTITYELVCSGSDRVNVTSSLTVTLSDPLPTPEILSFTTDKESYSITDDSSAHVFLAWNTRNVSSCQFFINNVEHSLETSGKWDLTLNEPTPFKLVCQNSDGLVVEKTLSPTLIIEKKARHQCGALVVLPKLVNVVDVYDSQGQKVGSLKKYASVEARYTSPHEGRWSFIDSSSGTAVERFLLVDDVLATCEGTNAELNMRALVDIQLWHRIGNCPLKKGEEVALISTVAGSSFPVIEAHLASPLADCQFKFTATEVDSRQIELFYSYFGYKTANILAYEKLQSEAPTIDKFIQTVTPVLLVNGKAKTDFLWESSNTQSCELMIDNRKTADLSANHALEIEVSGDSEITLTCLGSLNRTVSKKIKAATAIAGPSIQQFSASTIELNVKPGTPVVIDLRWLAYDADTCEIVNSHTQQKHENLGTDQTLRLNVIHEADLLLSCFRSGSERSTSILTLSRPNNCTRQQNNIYLNGVLSFYGNNNADALATLDSLAATGGCLNHRGSVEGFLINIDGKNAFVTGNHLDLLEGFLKIADADGFSKRSKCTIQSDGIYNQTQKLLPAGSSVDAFVNLLKNTQSCF